MLNTHLFYLKQAAGAKNSAGASESCTTFEGSEVMGLARAIRDQMTALPQNLNTTDGTLRRIKRLYA
jgi:hypothetical protein